MTTRCAAILSVGDEILAGRVLDRHAAYASSRLATVGVETRVQISVGDAPNELSKWLRRIASEVDFALVTGGLGPTEDDRTRAEVARAAAVDLEFRPESWERIHAEYGERLRSHERNKRQAYFPVGAVEIPNPHGTAPAFHMPGSHAGVSSSLGWWVLPGVPREFRALFDDVVIGRLVPEPASGDDRDILRVFGVSESVLDAWLIETIPPPRHTEYHVCVTDGEIEIHAPCDLDLVSKAQIRFGDRFVGCGSEDLAHRVVGLARTCGAIIATAESCTGGRLAGRLTDVPGASRCFERGWVTYADQAKVAELGVDAEIIRAHGAVSAETADAMVRGAARRASATHAVAISGVSGPGGGTPEKPVGTTYIAILGPSGIDARLLALPGDRERVRALAVQHALFGLFRALGGPDGQTRQGSSP